MSLEEALDWELPVDAGVVRGFAPAGRSLEMSGRFFSCSFSLETFMRSQGGELEVNSENEERRNCTGGI